MQPSDNLSTFPKPPVCNSAEPPSLDGISVIKAFGTTYRIIDGLPYLHIEQQAMDKQKIGKLVNSSINSFVEFLNTFNPDHINEIVCIHTTINELICKSFMYSAPAMIEKDKMEEQKRKRRIVDKLIEISK